VRDRRGISLNGAEFRRDIGGVSQLMETQLAKICNSMVIEFCKDILRVSQRIKGCQILKMKKNIEL